MRVSKFATSALIILIGIAPGSAIAAKSYEGAITAKELLVLTGACNLTGVPGGSREMQTLLTTMCHQGIALLKIGTVFDEKPRWLWQPGAMRDHPDFRFAGNRNIGPALPEAPVEGISLDSSHFFAKWPLFFLAGRDAAPPEDATFFSTALAGIAENLFSRVVDGRPPTGECVIRYRTYTDGTNGVFRWNWQNKGVHYGSGAYQQSMTPFYSSMALLDDPRISKHYDDIYSCYPYTRSVLNSYFYARDLEPYQLLVSLARTRPSEIATLSGIPTEEQKQLYRKHLQSRLLGTPAIIEGDAYDAVVGIRMMVMHYAFLTRYQPWIDDFFNYADQASRLICHDCGRFESLYHELHLVHFLTRFTFVASKSGYTTHPLFPGIYSRTAARVQDLYLNQQREVVSTPGWNGVHLYNFKDYTEWKLGFYGAVSPRSPDAVTVH